MRHWRWGRWVAALAAPLLLTGHFVASALADGSAPAPSAPSASSSSAPSAATALPSSVAPEKWSDAAGFPAITSADPSWGARTAPVTIVVFADFQCPFCAALSKTLDDLKRKYGPQKLRVVFKHEPLTMHKNARAAAIAGEVAFELGGNGVFWAFAAKAFGDQHNLDESHLFAFSKEAGVDPNGVTSEAIKRATKKVDADIAVATAAGVTGTPTSFVNGVVVSGSQTTEKFSKTIDEQLALADALKGKVKADKVYVTLSKKAKLAADAERKKQKPPAPKPKPKNP